MAPASRSRLGQWLQRGTSYDVLKRAPVPVLVVPPRWRMWNPRPTIRRILVPLDGSALAEEALQPAQALAAAMNAGIELLRVVSLPGAASLTHGSPALDR
jgi:nucleotide-binding universal stress UspA family protein